MEAVTAFVEGPACFLAVYGILARRPWAYTVQILVSLGQAYGDVLYFSTTVLEGAAAIAAYAEFVPVQCQGLRPSVERPQAALASCASWWCTLSHRCVP